MKEGLTLAEREAIVEEAIRLIKRPDTFIQGDWKCPLYQKPKSQELVPVRGGHLVMVDLPLSEKDKLVPATDSQGRPMFAYCVEGAVNQAGINLLGLDRAIDLGAATGIEEYGEPEPAHSSTFIEYLSVNQVARVQFADLLENYGIELESECAAQYINDGDEREPDKALAHSRVMQILRGRLQQLRGKS